MQQYISFSQMFTLIVCNLKRMNSNILKIKNKLFSYLGGCTPSVLAWVVPFPPPFKKIYDRVGSLYELKWLQCFCHLIFFSYCPSFLFVYICLLGLIHIRHTVNIIEKELIFFNLLIGHFFLFLSSA